jgi:predicted RNase H-like nuclease (RuvC/YqgF family)
MTNLEKVEERLAELDQEIAQLKSQNSVLIDDVAEQRKQVVNKTNSLYNVESEKEELEQLVQDLSSEVAQRRKVMTHLGVDLDQLVKHIAPKVDGVVTGVDSNIIVVSLGRDDGLRRDHKVDIFRGDRFVATAVVLTANHNISSARILPEFQLSKVREGDHVTTKL